MPAVKYGTQEIQFHHIVDKALKHAYITVDFYEGVVLKSPPISQEKAKEAVYKKGKWVLEKLKLVERIPQGKIVSGSRLLYLGRRYYVEIVPDDSIKKTEVRFTHSKFEILLNPALPDQGAAINEALQLFFREKAAIKIAPRVEKWSKTTGLMPSAVKFRRLSKRWGSCTADNEIIFNHDTVKLPFTLIDYIVVHEICHIKHKDHSKDFYRELAKYMADWAVLEERLCGMRL